MSNVRLYCPRGSKGAMVLVRGLRERGLNILRIKRRGSRYRGNSSHQIINWGASSGPDYLFEALNKPSAVRKASDKLLTFESNSDISVPFTTDSDVAQTWLAEDNIVFSRGLTCASEGRGITVVHPGDQLPMAPLYTKGVVGCGELRIFIFRGEIFHEAKKMRLSSESREERGITEEPDDFVRNTKNHWIFGFQNIFVSERSREIAIQALDNIGLDFGAVDIIQGDTESWVLEVNSAFGITDGSTTQLRFTDALLGYYSGCTE